MGRLRAARASCGHQILPPEAHSAGPCAVTVAAPAAAASTTTVCNGVPTATAAVTVAAGRAAAFVRARFCRGCCPGCSSPAHWQHRCQVGRHGNHYAPWPGRPVRLGLRCPLRRRACFCAARRGCDCGVRLVRGSNCCVRVAAYVRSLGVLPPGEPLVLAPTGNGAKRNRGDVSSALPPGGEELPPIGAPPKCPRWDDQSSSATKGSESASRAQL